jgi:hypothetical protein
MLTLDGLRIIYERNTAARKQRESDGERVSIGSKKRD